MSYLKKVLIIMLLVSSYSNIVGEETDSNSISFPDTIINNQKVIKGIHYSGGPVNSDSLLDSAFNSQTLKGKKFLKGGSFEGKRSRKNIMRTIFDNIAALRYAYNKRLKEKSDLAGKILVKFSINYKGKVLTCEVVDATLKDEILHKVIVGKIKKMKFGEIPFPNDITVVYYPFIFSK